ncbi:MAG: M3 family oligoendopeptidase [Erysipelotrichaceae bacterium]
MSTWNLDALYTGCEDPAFLADYQKLQQEIVNLESLSSHLTTLNETEGLIQIINTQQNLLLVASKLGAYLSLRQTCDTTNQEISSWLNKFSNLTSETAKSFATMSLWIAEVDLTKVDLETPLIKEHLFWIQEIKKEGAHLLDKETEAAISKMKLNASNTWETLREYLTSTLSIEFNNETHTMSSIRNFAYDSDPAIRKAAYEAELKAYPQIQDSLAFALNSIKGQANVIAELRGYHDILDMTLSASRMKRSTLDAMLCAMRESLPSFHQYFKQKANLLNHTNGLPFYDLFANIGSCESNFTIEQSKEYLLKHFTPFSKEVADITETAYNQEWIDFFPKKGKVGGAFCYNLPFIKQSRILTNYNHTLSDVVTLAHELGHAYHGYCIEDHSPLNTDYSMPVAETASTFNETIIMNAAIKDAKTDDEKIFLLESSLQDASQVIVDILSRYIFETSVINTRKDEFLFPSQLDELMIQAQKEAYGDGLDPNYLHPSMWIVKGHYYSADLNFYNFPYAFGLLFAKGLYALYQKEGQSFTDKYHDLLHATTVSSVEEVAAIVGIDLSDVNFWRSSLSIITDSIEEFIQLTSK